MKGKIIAVVICCLLLSTTVEAQRPIRDFIDRILGREKPAEVQVTEIEDILANPEKYETQNMNDTITVAGTLGPRAGYEWMRGDIYGIYDGAGNAINVEVWMDRNKLMEEAKKTYGDSSVEAYQKVQKKYYDSIQSMMGEKVRVTGVFAAGNPGDEGMGPILLVILPPAKDNNTGMEVME